MQPMIADALVLPAATNTTEILNVAPLNRLTLGAVRLLSNALYFSSNFTRILHACTYAASDLEGLTRDEFIYRLDNLATDPAIVDGVLACSEFTTTTPFKILAVVNIFVNRKRPPTAARAWQKLPPIAACAMAEGATYTEQIQETLRKLPRTPKRVGYTSDSVRRIQQMVYDPMLPVVVGELSMAAVRVGPSLFALGGMVIAGKSNSSTVIELAHAFRDGQRAALQLLASTPGADVPETILPKSERIDFEKLVKETEAYWAEVDATHSDIECM